MLQRIVVTGAFFVDIVRDLVGTLRSRWRVFRARVVDGEETAVVAVDIYPFFAHLTGVGLYAWNLLASLDRRDDGLRYNLYGRTFLAPDDPPAPEMPGHRNMRFRVHQIPPGFLLPVGPTLAVLRLLVEPLLRYLDGNDVLFAPNFFPHGDQEPFSYALVVTVHDLAFAARSDTVAPATLADLGRNLPRTLYHADRIIAVSDATAGELVERLGCDSRTVRTVHEGVAADFADGLEHEIVHDVPEQYLLFVSTLEPRKNVNGILEAFRLLVEWGYEGDLVLVGRWGWRTESIRRELADSPVAKRIHHLDTVDRRELPAIYGRAEALLFPSWLEGFGLPIVESMACGTPVITSGTSAMPEVAGPAAIYIDPASPHGIASATAALLRDPEHRDRLVRLGRERAAKFDWDRAARATAAILRDTAGLPTEHPDEFRV
ncbi:MAG: glycosyltransferase family 1 protein [Holophagae bacterium]|jgi:glycosyltransferase involved in cell wall biosynthesis